MARTSHTLNYRRSSTNYSCRSYDGKEGQSYALTFLAGGQTCYVPLVSTSSAYASYLRVMYGGSEYSPAKLMPEYKATWTHIGYSEGVPSKSFNVDLDYDQLYSSGLPYNIQVDFEIVGTVGLLDPKVTIDGITYPMTSTTMYFRVRASEAGKGSVTTIPITIYSNQIPPTPPYYRYYNTHLYCVTG